MSFFRKYLSPVLTLVLICICVGAILASVNALTAPVIEANEIRSANETYFAVLPEADSFTELQCTVDGVTTVLRADNGSGYVIIAQARGYGGQVPAAVAFDCNGIITNVILTSNDETPGLGQKVTAESFYNQFSGKPAEAFTISDIDAVSGATISSKAAVNAINLAIKAYWEIMG